MNRFLNFEKVLCLSPHPDDIEYSALGTIIKFKDTNFEIITFSNGGKFDKSTSSKRVEECIDIWSKVSNLNGSFLNEKFLVDAKQDELIFNVENKYDLDSYQAILIPAEFDTHQDHKKISDLGKALTRKSQFTIIEYKTPHTLNNWIPNLYINIDELIPNSEQNIWEFKKELLKMFYSQQNQPYFENIPLQNFHIDYHSSRKKINIVESFKIITSYF